MYWRPGLPACCDQGAFDGTKGFAAPSKGREKPGGECNLALSTPFPDDKPGNGTCCAGC